MVSIKFRDNLTHNRLEMQKPYLLKPEYDRNDNSNSLQTNQLNHLIGGSILQILLKSVFNILSFDI